jgi:hypothetical protein
VEEGGKRRRAHIKSHKSSFGINVIMMEKCFIHKREGLGEGGSKKNSNIMIYHHLKTFLARAP